MMVDSKICKYVRPDSSIDADAEEYEYYIVWQGVDQGVYHWLFTDFTHTKKRTANIISSNSENITSQINKLSNFVQIVAEDLTENQADVIIDIVRAKIIRRYYKDGTYTNIAIKTNTIKKVKSDHRYNVGLEIQEQDSNILG